MKDYTTQCQCSDPDYTTPHVCIIPYVVDNDSEDRQYTGKKSEYSKTQQGNFMKVHPLDRI